VLDARVNGRRVGAWTATDRDFHIRAAAPRKDLRNSWLWLPFATPLHFDYS
jgi:hypothetical protein